MRYFTVFLLTLFCVLTSNAQEKQVVKGVIYNDISFLPVDDVNVINLSKVKGAVSRLDGSFEIEASLNDSIHFSYPGYLAIKLKVTNDWLKDENVKIYLTEQAYTLDEIIIKKYELTGYLESDTKLIELENRMNYNFNKGKGTLGYYSNPSIGSYFSPVDVVYNIFKGKSKNLKKLEAVKEDQNMLALLQTRYDRETVCGLLGITRQDIVKTLENCNHTDRFIYTATDFQVYQALNECYEQSKIMANQNRSNQK